MELLAFFFFFSQRPTFTILTTMEMNRWTAEVPYAPAKVTAVLAVAAAITLSAERERAKYARVHLLPIRNSTSVTWEHSVMLVVTPHCI